MKEKIRKMIVDFVYEYEHREEITTKWGEPLVGFANADHPYIKGLPVLISNSHGQPKDVMKNASIVVVYYVPFTKELAQTNKTGTFLASADWARAYEETNAMFGKLNEYLISQIKKEGYQAGISPKMATFDQKKLISDWSFRHFAYAAGLGTFGMNNMLITKKGCCGRYNTIVTNLDVIPDEPVETEYCLYKRNGSCGVCMKNCPTQALSPEGYDRHKCYKILQKNAEIYTDFGSSYTNEEGTEANSVGSEVCGKCVTQSPCAFRAW